VTLAPREVVRTPARQWRRYPEYKDSGIEWLGDIPNHWKLTPLRYIFDVVGGSTPSSGIMEYWEGDIPWVTPEDLGRLTDDTVTATKRQITEAGLRSCGTTLVPAGSLVLSTKAVVNAVGPPLRCLLSSIAREDSERPTRPRQTSGGAAVQYHCTTL
jgi:hypothetical protein